MHQSVSMLYNKGIDKEICWSGIREHDGKARSMETGAFRINRIRTNLWFSSHVSHHHLLFSIKVRRCQNLLQELMLFLTSGEHQVFLLHPSQLCDHLEKDAQNEAHRIILYLSINRSVRLIANLKTVSLVHQEALSLGRICHLLCVLRNKRVEVSVVFLRHHTCGKQPQH